MTRHHNQLPNNIKLNNHLLKSDFQQQLTSKWKVISKQFLLAVDRYIRRRRRANYRTLFIVDEYKTWAEEWWKWSMDGRLMWTKCVSELDDGAHRGERTTDCELDSILICRLEGMMQIERLPSQLMMLMADGTLVVIHWSAVPIRWRQYYCKLPYSHCVSSHLCPST